MSPRDTDSRPGRDSSDEALGATLPLEGPIPSPPPAMAGGSQGAPLVGADAAAPAGQGNYRIETELARGGIGRVMVARDLRLDRPVAIKELIELRDDALRRFEREARITARLQHPSIVGVHEAGCWPDGRPFYAMELVQGRSLDQVVAAARTRADRLALVPRVLAVAEALAYAHGQRVIHRDLKPANVLCGDFGETVVIDWGLGKELGGEAAEPAASGPLVSQDGGTVAGTVLGTPAYMPPEQATGEPVDERVDVYALGAILYHVLSGRPPYHDAPPAEVLARVRLGSPPPLAEAAPGCPRDLCGIVDKAMARDPARRYPTARELAADLQRFQTGQLVAAHRYSPAERLRRFVGRHRGAVAVAAVLLAVLAATSIYGVRRIVAERDAAERQRDVAERRGAAAEELVDFMLYELRDRLKPIGRLDALAGVGDAVERYYAQRSADEPLDATAIGRRAAALETLGDVRRSQGDVDGARAAYQQSLELRLARAAASDELVAQRAVAHSLERLGLVAEGQGRLRDARNYYQDVVDRRRSFLARNPGDAAMRDDLAVALDNLGRAREWLGDLPGALAGYQPALALRRELRRERPDDAGTARDLAISLLHVGDVLRQQGAIDDALGIHREGLALAEEARARAPENRRVARDLTLLLGRVGRLHELRGESDQALTAYRRSVAVMQELVALDPENGDWADSLAGDHQHVGDILHERKNHREALVEYERALAILRPLASHPGADTDWQRNLSAAWARIGRERLSLADTEGALAAVREGSRITRELAARDPANLALQRDVAVDHDQLAFVHLARKDARSALAAFRDSLAVSERLVAHDPSNAEWQTDVADAHFKIGQVIADYQGDRTAARAHYDAALEVIARLSAAGRLTDEQKDWSDEIREARDALRR